MTNKIQMTEEQADRFISDLNIKKYKDSIDFDDINLFIIHRMKKEGYIIKSELQQKVEEAEAMYNYWYSDKETNCEVVMDAMKIAIEALKQSHPEFKK